MCVHVSDSNMREQFHIGNVCIKLNALKYVWLIFITGSIVLFKFLLFGLYTFCLDFIISTWSSFVFVSGTGPIINLPKDYNIVVACISGVKKLVCKKITNRPLKQTN